MFPNILIVLASAFIPLFVGFIYYNPKVLGTVWMKATGLTEEKMKGANMLVIFGVSLLLSFLMSMFLFGLVVHQTDIYSLLINEKGFGEEGSAVMNTIKDLMDAYGNNFRTFKHGALHGALVGFFIIFPMITTNAMFERKSFKYSLINSGYWIISLALMGGTLSQWG
jgi:hypothetical protein